MKIPILDIIPEVGKIVDDLITTDEEVREAKLKQYTVESNDLKARLGVMKTWLGNKSPYVAGAIPTILWMISLVILFNHIIAPLFSWGGGKPLPVLQLPPYYVDFGKTIIYALFAKKAYDSTEVSTSWLKSPRKGD